MHSLVLAHDLVRTLADPYNPGSGKEPPGEVTAKLHTLMDWVAYIVTALCVVGIIVVAGRMAIMHRRGEGGEHAAGLAWVAAACILVGSASAVVGALT